MSKFTAKDVQLLRQRTGVGMMDCKDALTVAEGDIERAIEVLREKGIAKAAKKADRIAAQGLVYAKTENGLGVLVEVNSETDFVARNEKFKNFVEDVATTILENKPKDVENLKQCQMFGKGLNVDEALKEIILMLGENIKIRRFVIMSGHLVSYVHGVGNIGVMVKFETDLFEKAEFLEYGKNIAMHIAASYTQYLDKNSVPEKIIEKEKQILKQQMADSKKPDEIVKKIVDGKMNKFYEDVCLLNQKFVKNDELTVLKYTEETSKKLGGTIKIIDFCRMETGEGIDTGENNFADEVASLIK